MNDFGNTPRGGNGRGDRPRYLTPLVLKQLFNAKAVDGHPFISRRHVVEFTTCAFVAETHTDQMQHYFVLDDTTSSYNIFFHLDQVPNHESLEHKYIRVYGYLRSTHDTVTAYVNKVVPVEYDELLHHQLESLWYHLKTVNNKLDGSPNSSVGTGDASSMSLMANNASFSGSIPRANPADENSVYQFFLHMFERSHRSFEDPVSRVFLLHMYNDAFPSFPIDLTQMDKIVGHFIYNGMAYTGEHDDSIYLVKM